MEAVLETKKANDQAMLRHVNSTTLLFFTHVVAKIVLSVVSNASTSVLQTAIVRKLNKHKSDYDF